MSDTIERIDFGALPHSGHATIIQDRIFLDDNLDYNIPENQRHGSRRPYKLLTSIQILIIQGTFKIKANQRDIVATKNDLLLLLPGTIIEGYDIGEDCRLLICAAKAKHEKQLDKMPPKSALAIVSMLMGVEDPFKITLDDEYCELFKEQIMLERKCYPLIHPDFLEDVLFGHFNSVAAILASSLRCSIEDLGPKINRNRETELMAKFMEAVHKYASTQRGVAFYADKACLSPKYFARIITKVSGKKPAFWIKQYAILEAKALLATGNYSIQQISDRMNFPNPSFFCKYFRQEVGMSPGKFMKSR